MIDSVEEQAQDRGYADGRRGLSCDPGKYRYEGHLLRAYKRGWELGRKDQDKGFRL